MRVGLITLHKSYSYGACLQAFATYKSIEKMGYDVEFVDYANSYEQNQNKIISRKKDSGVLKNVITTLENLILLQSYNRKLSFSKFHKQFKLSKRFKSFDQLIDAEYDVLISGSDQLWNPQIFAGIDPAFFLDFGKAKKRVSYAASAGSYVFNEKEIFLIKSYLDRYSEVSVREEFLKDQVKNLLHKEISIVADPTFLISAAEWIEFSKKPQHHKLPESYILLYMIGVPYKEYTSHYKPIVDYYKEKLHLPVYAISSFSFIGIDGADGCLNRLTPEELLYVINHASMVISSSFHGIAFSITFNKQFVALKNSNPARLDNLLKTLDLQYQYLDPYAHDSYDKFLNNIDYSSANIKLEKLRDYSLNWLRNAIK